MINQSDQSPIITDITKKPPTNLSPFIIISNNIVSLCVLKHKFNNNTVILGINFKLVDRLLEKNKIESKNYLCLGDIFSNPNDPSTNPQIILAHKSICSNINYWKQIESIGDSGYIFEPTNNSIKNYTSIGLFFMKNNIGTNNELATRVGIIPRAIVEKYSNSSNAKFFSNDYGLLSSDLVQAKTIKKIMFKKNKKMLVISAFDKYLTNSNSNPNPNSKSNVQLSDPEPNPNTNPNQIVSYDTQGQLSIDDKCLTYYNNSTGLKFDTCNGEPNQKWSMYENKISPMEDMTKCLSVDYSDDSQVNIIPCSNEKSIDQIQTWNTADVSGPSVKDYQWDKYKGKTVVLVESNDPWYLNKDTTIQTPLVKNNQTQPLNSVPIRTDADYNSCVVLNPDKPNLGLGYDYMSRTKSIKCKNNESKIEGFGKSNACGFGSNFSVNNNIIYVLIILLILLLIYKNKTNG